MANKDVTKLVRDLRAAGWRVERVSGHYKAYAPNGEDIVTISSTPSTQGWKRKTLALLRRAGYEE